MKPIITYSKLIEDDGGFEKLYKELDKAEAIFKQKAKALEGLIKVSDNNDSKTLEKYRDEVELLKKALSDLNETNKAIRKSENDYKETVKEHIKITKQQAEANENARKQLEDFYISQENLKNEIKAVTEAEKKGNITSKEAVILRGKYRNELKQILKDTAAVEKAISQSNKESEKENALLKAKLIIENKQVDTLENIAERMKALRLVVKNTNITTDEGREAVRQMNNEINQLSDVLSENSDKFIQNKMQIGNYKENIVDAIKETGFLSTGIGALDGMIDKLIGSLKSSKKATDQNTEAIDNSSRATNNFSKTAKGLSTALKATGVLLFLGLLTSVFAIFKQGRSGVVKTEQAMAVFGATTKVVINILANFGKGIVDFFRSLGPTFSNIGKYFDLLGLKAQKFFIELNPFGDSKEKVRSLEKEMESLRKEIDANSEAASKLRSDSWEKMGESVRNFKKDVEAAKESVKTSINGIERAFVIADKIKAGRLELTKLRSELQAAEIASDDATQGLRFMLKAAEDSGEKAAKVFEKEIELLKLQLEVANTKAKADLQAHGKRVANMNIENGSLQTQIAFTQQLLSLNQKLGGGERNPLDDELLTASVDVLEQLKEKQNEYQAFTLDLSKKEREIKRDLFEQDLDLLIDLIDTEKNLSEQYVNNSAQNLEDRFAEMDRFEKKFKDGTKKQMDLFSRTAKDQGLDLDFNIQWKDDGSFDVFINDQKLALDNIVELNEQLQSANLSEIAINRFREFVVESRNGQKDMKDLNKELAETARKMIEIKGEKIIDEKELESIRLFKDRLSEIKTNSLFSTRQKDKLSKELEKFEKEQTKKSNEFERERLENRIKAIDDELKYKGKASEDALNLTKERVEVETQIEQMKIDQVKNNLDEFLSKQTEWEKFSDRLGEIFDNVLDKFSEMSQKQVDITESNLEKQQNAVEKQRDRAAEGLENSLAFEQKELEKREAEKIKAEKKLQRTEKIKSLWSSYSSNSSNKEIKNPLTKTLTDFAVLEAFAASFGDGGLAEDVLSKVPTNGKGITRGRSHNGKGGGIPVLIEGNEGFLSKREVNNLGKDNFYKLKNLAGRGVVDPDLFNEQNNSIKTVVLTKNEQNSDILVNEIKTLKTAISNIKTTNLDAFEVVDGVLNFTETIIEGNKTKRNHYKVDRKRI